MSVIQFSALSPCLPCPPCLISTHYFKIDRLLDESGNKVTLKIDRYFESGFTVCQWNMHRLKYHWQAPYWRYTPSQWSSLIAKAGFTTRRLHEPRPTLEQVQNKPELEDCYRLKKYWVLSLCSYIRRLIKLFTAFSFSR